MVSLVKRLMDACEGARLRRRARRDGSPKSAVELCRHLLVRGDLDHTLETTRQWLARFPHSHDLQDLSHQAFKMQREERAYALQNRILEGPSVGAYRDLVAHYVQCGELDEAVQVGDEMVRRYRRLARSHHLRGVTRLERFRRDRVADDGAAALESLQQACTLDPNGFESRLALARSFFEIGANAKASWHLLIAMEQHPNHPEAEALHAELQSLPLSASHQEHEKSLLVDVEEHDRVRRGRTRERVEQKLRETILHGIQQLSLNSGVKQVCAHHKGFDGVAEQGEVRRVRGPGESRFVDFAQGFRKAASVALKRMGLGTLQEAELTLEESTVLGYAGDTSVLMVELIPNIPSKHIADDGRNLLATWTAKAA